MTRKDYIQFAAMLRNERQHWGYDGFPEGDGTQAEADKTEGAYRALDRIEKRLADIFAADNPRFNRDHGAGAQRRIK